MTVYAIFLCIAAMHQRRLAEGGRMLEDGGYMPGIIYRTREECEHKVALYNRVRSPTMSYRCFAKHVDTWSPSQ